MVDGGLGDAHDSSTWLSAATRREQITSVRIEPDAVLSSQLQLGCRIAVAELGVITKPLFQLRPDERRERVRAFTPQGRARRERDVRTHGGHRPS